MTETSHCPRCGAVLEAGTAPGGLCVRCLYAAARGGPRSGATGGDESAGEVIFTSAGVPSPEPPSIATLAPHFPQLELVERIGVGGMGAVYRARQKSLGREIALKVLHEHVAAVPGFAERFSREARTLASLQHPNLVTVHDCGEAGPWYYFAMELVDGASLRQLMRAREVGPREALAIVTQVCDALQYAHDQGVVHRDIKPDNILVDRTGRVKILDFGLAKLVGAGAGAQNLTRTHQVMGTPHYMAPEQWERPLAVDHRADIFSLGVVFYELLTGELPVGRFDPPSKRVTVDVRLDEVVLRTLEREPERRYQRASEVGEDVTRIRDDAPTAAPEPRDGDGPAYAPRSGESSPAAPSAEPRAAATEPRDGPAPRPRSRGRRLRWHTALERARSRSRSSAGLDAPPSNRRRHRRPNYLLVLVISLLALLYAGMALAFLFLWIAR